MTIELFSGARWHGIKFLDGVEVIEERLRHGLTWKPSPAHQIIITAIHHLLYNGSVPQKYRKEIVSLIEFEENAVEKNLTPTFGPRHAKNLTQELINENWLYFDADVARALKVQLLIRSIFSSPLSTLIDILKGLISHFRNPEGVYISIDITSELAKRALIESLLGIMIKWHVFKPPRREFIDPVMPVRRAKRRVRSILSSGGVVLIDHASASELYVGYTFPVYKIVQSERLVVFCQSVEIFSCRESLNTNGDNADHVSLEIINAVLSHRASLNKGLSF